MSQYSVKTPHAAVIVWNYADRIGTPTGEFNSSGTIGNGEYIDQVERSTIISTLSCVSIQTSKSKSQPDGQFNLVLAPYKNWVSTLTAGSWCCILMSNEPITEADLRKANKNHVKMIGRIETVRCETQADDDGTRKTLYYVSGVDWGHIFNSVLYIDNLIGEGQDADQRNAVAVELRKILFGDNGSPTTFTVKDNLSSLLNVMGKPLDKGYTEAGDTIGRIGKTVYEFRLPNKMIEFFDFRGPDGKSTDEVAINKMLTLVTGTLIDKDTYIDAGEAVGFINPFSLQGTHSLWQILLENSNPALNEMFCDFKWSDKNNGLQLAIYNRIRPFAYKEYNPNESTGTRYKNVALENLYSGNASKLLKAEVLTSYFQFVKIHEIESNDVISVNAGTNWRDKFNFVEIKPQFQEFAVFANWYKQKAQAFDQEAFKREGFRPIIFDTKQFPSGTLAESKPDAVLIDWDELEIWVNLLRKWYFGTHMTLNGTLVMHGTTEYIGVGNNIRFDAGLLNPNTNLNWKTNKEGKNHFILAHVESVSHSFTVGADGARSYRTTINFVRGISVKENNQAIGVHGGAVDRSALLVPSGAERNTKNVNSTSDVNDPDRLKKGGT